MYICTVYVVQKFVRAILTNLTCVCVCVRTCTCVYVYTFVCENVCVICGMYINTYVCHMHNVLAMYETTLNIKLMCLYSNCFVDPTGSEGIARINWNTL